MEIHDRSFSLIKIKSVLGVSVGSWYVGVHALFCCRNFHKPLSLYHYLVWYDSTQSLLPLPSSLNQQSLHQYNETAYYDLRQNEQNKFREASHVRNKTLSCWALYIGPGIGLLLPREYLSHDKTYFRMSARTFDSMLWRGSNIRVNVIGGTRTTFSGV